MDELKLVGEINCRNCNKPIKIDSVVDISDRLTWNNERKQCPNCNHCNVITADIRVIDIDKIE